MHVHETRTYSAPKNNAYMKCMSNKYAEAANNYNEPYY